MYVLCQLGGIIFLRKNGTMHPNHVKMTNLKVILKLMQLLFMLGWQIITLPRRLPWEYIKIHSCHLSASSSTFEPRNYLCPLANSSCLI